MAPNPVSASAGPAASGPLRVLSRGDVDAFRNDGYVFPLRALDAAQTARYRLALESAEARVGGPLRAAMRSKPHLFLAWAAELVRCPAILDAVEDLFGPNLLCWSSSFFIKDAHDPGFVSWHQDSTYWGLSHPDVVTAWVALSPSDTYNGCMRVIPGTHLRDQLPHRDTFAPNNLLTRGQEVEVAVDERDAVNVVLQPGEFSLHHVRLVHGSEPNRSDVRRIGYAIRYIPTYVRQLVGARDTATLVRGVDDYGHFDPEPRPEADFDPEAMAFHRQVVEETNAVLYRGTGNRNPL
jgi:non-haem Fe2+, alpha-ketoglutarate-dependent halogenase